ncbi:MAG: response regulator [Deltaproteobacteria bacterium]|nr:response regulator [Deltaproteobacteria bacterium]
MADKLLVVDDEPEIRELARVFFVDGGYLVDTAASGNEAIARLVEQDYDVVITDLMMPDGNGEEVLAWVMETKPYIGVIIMTGYGSVESAVSLMKMGAVDYILKPFILAELKVVVERCINNRNLRQENKLIREAYEKMAEVRAMKDKFIALTSHELKTPVTVINTIAGFLEQRLGNDQEMVNFINLLKKSAANLDVMVRDMYQLAQSQEGTMPLHFTEVDLVTLISEVIEDIRLLASERRLTLDFPDRDAPPVILQLDREKIVQAFFELIQNAVKFTPDQGAITLTVTADRTDDGREQAVVEIIDTGIGIEASEREKVFEKFYKIHDVRRHHSSESAFLGGGLGVGLPLARGLINAHGGKIAIGDNPGGGTRITIILPAGTAIPAAG